MCLRPESGRSLSSRPMQTEAAGPRSATARHGHRPTLRSRLRPPPRPSQPRSPARPSRPGPSPRARPGHSGSPPLPNHPQPSRPLAQRLGAAPGAEAGPNGRGVSRRRGRALSSAGDNKIKEYRPPSASPAALTPRRPSESARPRAREKGEKTDRRAAPAWPSSSAPRSLARALRSRHGRRDRVCGGASPANRQLCRPAARGHGGVWPCVVSGRRGGGEDARAYGHTALPRIN